MAHAAGEDSLLPWLRSIRQVKQSFPNDKSKLLPCVSECFRLFRNDERYRNDIRFLKICVQYADCSPDPLAVVSELDEKGIGRDHALFYEAYATCLEAKRRFGDANNIYKRGLSRQAQPCEKLESSYKLFRDRMDARKKKRKQEQVEIKNPVQGEEKKDGKDEMVHHSSNEKQARIGEEGGVKRMADEEQEGNPEEQSDVSVEEMRLTYMLQQQHRQNQNHKPEQHERGNDVLFSHVPAQICSSSSFGEETIQIRNFAAKAITGKEKDVEDAQHHGLVDPTVNTKEAIQYILSMFREPMDLRKKKASSEKQTLLFSASPPPAAAAAKWMKQPMEFCAFSDDWEESEDPGKAANGQQESGFFVFKDDEAEEQGEEDSGDEKHRGLERTRVLAEKKVNEDQCDLFVFRDEEAAPQQQGKKAHEKKLSPVTGLENAEPPLMLLLRH